MVDRIVSCDAEGALSEYEIPEEGFFVRNGRLTAAGIIENMAQTCAARISHMNRHREGKPQGDLIGVIGEIRDFEIMREPSTCEMLCTEITIVQEIFNMNLAEIVSRIGNEAIATARFKIALATI